MKDNKILNKQINISDILDAAEFLERYKDNWKQKFMSEESKNKNLDWSEKNYTYYNGSAEIKYTICFKDGNTLTETSFEWFIQNLRNSKIIDNVYFYLSISFWTKKENGFDSGYYDNHNKIYVNMDFRENKASIDVDTMLQENEGRIIYNSLMGIFDKCEARHDKVIKKRGRIIQFYCIAIGLFLSYIVFGAYKFYEMNNLEEIPEFLTVFFDNSLFIVLGQWGIAFLLGNMFAYRSIYKIYEPIIPEAKYMGYDYTMNSGIYRDDVDDFKGHSEVHIGKYYDASDRRNKIKSKYKFAKFILFLQVLASVFIYFMLEGFSI